jgi:hypothetical protein
LRPATLEDLQIGAKEEATKGDSEMKKGRFTEEQTIGVLNSTKQAENYWSWHGRLE